VLESDGSFFRHVKAKEMLKSCLSAILDRFTTVMEQVVQVASTKVAPLHSNVQRISGGQQRISMKASWEAKAASGQGSQLKLHRALPSVFQSPHIVMQKVT